VKHMVVFDLSDKTVEGLWLNVKFVAEAFGAMSSPVIQEMELGVLWYRWSRAENMSCFNCIPQLMVMSLPVPPQNQISNTGYQSQKMLDHQYVR
jgi:hypothetical protein